MLLKDILREARDYFGMDYGIISHIFNDQYQIVACDGKDDAFKVGDVFPLEGVYCNVVYKAKSMYAINDIESSSGKILHPLYKIINLRSYIGDPLIINDEVYGTLNFTSFNNKETPFNQNDLDKMTLYSSKIVSQLEHM